MTNAQMLNGILESRRNVKATKQDMIKVVKTLHHKYNFTVQQIVKITKLAKETVRKYLND